MLQAASEEELSEDEPVGNPWCLIRRRDQETFEKPTNTPVEAFESGFIGATPEELQEFVASRFGPDGAGKASDDENSLNYISTESFAIIDERTVRDKTIRYWRQDAVSIFEEASIRVTWDQASEEDKVLARFVEDEDLTHEELVVLARRALPEGETMDESNENALHELVGEWFSQEDQQAEDKWFEFTLSVPRAVLSTCGIWHKGVAYLLTERHLFDEDGVLN